MAAPARGRPSVAAGETSWSRRDGAVAKHLKCEEDDSSCPLPPGWERLWFRDHRREHKPRRKILNVEAP